jgi:hypothetical protein
VNVLVVKNKNLNYLKQHSQMKRKIFSIFSSMLVSASLLAQTPDTALFNPTITFSDLIRPVAKHGMEVTVQEVSVVTGTNMAQVFIRLEENSISGQSVTFTSVDQLYSKTVTVSGRFILATLPVNATFTVHYLNGSYELPPVVTSPNVGNEYLSVSASVIRAVTINSAYREGKEAFVTMLDSDGGISYFEKLKLLQQHFLGGKPVSEELFLDDDVALTKELAFQAIQPKLFGSGARKSRGDDWPWNQAVWTAQLDENGFPYWPDGVKGCYSTLLLNHGAVISHWVADNKVLFPYEHINYTPFSKIHQWTGGGNREDTKDGDLMGASAAKILMNHGWWTLWLGHANYENQSMEDSMISQRLIYNFLVTDGHYFGKTCGCQKRINVGWNYEDEQYCEANVLGSGGGKSASAHTYDQGIGFILSLNTGAIEVTGIGQSELQVACEQDLNPEWKQTATGLAGDIAGLALTVAGGVLAGPGTDTTKDSTWYHIITDVIADPTHILGVVTGISNLIMTQKYVYTGSCGDKSSSTALVNTNKDIFIAPNQTFAFVLASTQKQFVEGKKHWKSQCSIKSNGYISTYVYPKGTPYGTIATEKECCSKQMAEWLQTGLTATEQASNKYEIRQLAGILGYNWEAQYTFMGQPNVEGNYGYMFGARPSDCKIPVKIQGDAERVASSAQVSLPLSYGTCFVSTSGSDIQLHVSNEWVGSNYTLYNSAGTLVARGAVRATSCSIFTELSSAAGLYVIRLHNTSNTKSINFRL